MTRNPAPPRYKLALLTWVGAYAVITLILAALGPAMAAWPLPLRTLLLSALMAPAMTWLVIPFLTRVFSGWLGFASPEPPRRARARPPEWSARGCGHTRSGPWAGRQPLRGSR